MTDATTLETVMVLVEVAVLVTVKVDSAAASAAGASCAKARRGSKSPVAKVERRILNVYRMYIVLIVGATVRCDATGMCRSGCGMRRID